MSERTPRSPDREKITLKGERPPGVVGDMNPEEALEIMRRARTERTSAEDEQSWSELDRILREDPV